MRDETRLRVGCQDEESNRNQFIFSRYFNTRTSVMEKQYCGKITFLKSIPSFSRVKGMYDFCLHIVQAKLERRQQICEIGSLPLFSQETVKTEMVRGSSISSTRFGIREKKVIAQEIITKYPTQEQGGSDISTNISGYNTSFRH